MIAAESCASQLLGHALQLIQRDATTLGHLSDVDLGQALLQDVEIPGVGLDECRIRQPLAGRQRRGDPEQEKSVASGLRLEMAICLTGGLGLPGVHDDHALVRVLRETLEGVVGIVPTIRDPGVRPQREQQIRVLDIGVEPVLRRRVEHPLVDQEVLRLFLAQRVEPPG